MGGIKEAMEQAVGYLSEHPEEARYTDSLARATLGDTLRVDVEGPGGERIATDMPKGVGGRGEQHSPGWLFRAAALGIELTSVEVEVDSESDDRGILGMDEGIPAGPLSMRVRAEASATGVDDHTLRDIVERGASRCPVFDAIGRAVSVTLEIEIA